MNDQREDRRNYDYTIFCMHRSVPAPLQQYEGVNAMTYFRTWLQQHEEAQVMVASILIVIGIWWFVRTVLTLLINLACPFLIVIIALVCVPQLREPLLGQNYPMLASVLRSILLKMAENIKT